MRRELLVNGNDIYHVHHAQGSWGILIRKLWGQADLSHRQNFTLLRSENGA